MRGFKKDSINNLYLSYSLFILTSLLVMTLITSVVLFFHFNLDHDLSEIESHLKGIIIISKFSTFILYFILSKDFFLRDIKTKVEQTLRSWHWTNILGFIEMLFHNHQKFPKKFIFYFIIIFFINVIIFGHQNNVWLWNINFFWHFLFSFFFYFTDLFLIYLWSQKITDELTLTHFAILTLIFKVGTSLIIPYYHHWHFLSALIFFLFIFHILKFQNIRLSLLALMFYLILSQMLIGGELFQDQMGFFKINQVKGFIFSQVCVSFGILIFYKDYYLKRFPISGQINSLIN
jgi:hypothetical protein